MQPLDILSIGSAVVDVIFKSAQFTPHTLDGEMMLCEVYGGKADVEDAVITSGGAGTNTAVSFARQGLRAGVLAEIGVDREAQIIIDELRSDGVETDFLIEEENEHTGLSAILVASNGSRTALTYRGAARMLTPSDIPFEKISSIPWIHLSSIGNPDLIRQIFLFCREKNIKLSWNPSKNEILEIVTHTYGDFENCIEVLFLNELEHEAVREHQDFLNKLARTIVVTRGKDGGEVWQDGKKRPYASQPVPVVCELGAGDAFASGFVGALYTHQSIEQAIERGVKNGASVVGHLGAKKGLLVLKQIKTEK